MATIKRVDPPPVGIPMFTNGNLTSDWQRWFQDMFLAERGLATLANGFDSTSGSRLDGGRSDTVFDGINSRLDCGRSA